MEIIQQTLESPLVKNITEIYSNEIVPRLTKRNKVIAISAAIFLMVSYKISNVIHPPRKLRHIPHMGYFDFLSTFLKKEHMLQRSQIFALPLVNSEGSNGLYLRPGRLGWEVQITNPDAIKRVLLKHEQFPKFAQPKVNQTSLLYKFVGRPNIVNLNGEHWRDQRKIANPAFHRSMPVEMFGKLTQKMFGVMDTMEKTVDVVDLMERWTLDAIGKAGFDFDFNAIGDKENEWVKTYDVVNTGFVDPLFFMFPVLEAYFLWLFPKRRQAHQDLVKFQGMIRGVIEEKRGKIESGENQNENLDDNEKDLLTLMLESEMKGEGKMTDTELESNICLFFVAGHDTTANALSSAICFLAQNPDIQQRAREEAISILGDESEDVLPTVDETKRMSYINQIMKETLRLNGPAANIITRLATEDCELAGTFIPKNTKVTVNLFETMHSEKNWKNALKFDPDRFAAEGDGAQVSGKGMSWVPFGNGARQCIGMNFSLAEQRVMLSMLLRKFTWTLPDDSIHKDGLRASGIAVVGPKDLNVEFTKRY